MSQENLGIEIKKFVEYWDKTIFISFCNSGRVHTGCEKCMILHYEAEH